MFRITESHCNLLFFLEKQLSQIHHVEVKSKLFNFIHERKCDTLEKRKNISIWFIKKGQGLYKSKYN